MKVSDEHSCVTCGEVANPDRKIQKFLKTNNTYFYPERCSLCGSLQSLTTHYVKWYPRDAIPETDPEKVSDEKLP